MADSGVAEDGSWTPAFEGQRPPLQPGHMLSVRHGANSERLVKADAADLLAALAATDAPWLADVDAVALESWCFAVSMVRRLRVAVAEENAPEKRHDQLLAWERRLDRVQAALGFDPLSRERLTRDAAVARSIAAQGLAAVQARGSKARRDAEQ